MRTIGLSLAAALVITATVAARTEADESSTRSNASSYQHIDEIGPETVPMMAGHAVSCGDSRQSKECVECKNGGTTKCCEGSNACTVCPGWACWTDPPVAECRDKPC